METVYEGSDYWIMDKDEIRSEFEECLFELAELAMKNAVRANLISWGIQSINKAWDQLAEKYSADGDKDA